MGKPSLRNASIYCLVFWAAVWMVFMLMRFSSFDIRRIPGIGPIMLTALVAALVAPLVATGLAAAAVVRDPRAPRNFLTLGCAIAVLFGQVFLFLVSRWM